MKITKHAGKGSRTEFTPSRSDVRRLASKRATVNDYAKVGPNVVRNGPSILRKKP